MREYQKSVRYALRLIYVLIISLAFTEALKRLFLNDNTFVLPERLNIFYYLIFFSFITRFFIGAYRALTYDIEIDIKQAKVVIDSVGFLFQAIAFYIFALIYFNLVYTQWLIFTICIVDSIWLGSLALIYKIKDETFNEWIIHNLFFIVFLPLNIYCIENLYLLLGTSIIAFIMDFWLNWNSYFPIKKDAGLRIFVAGPYGDRESNDVIDKNVEEAKRIGKEIALKGHYPFIPHTMLYRWEEDKRFKLQQFKDIDFQWLEYCDALFFIGESPGANVEREIAQKKGLHIYESIEEVPSIIK